MLRKDIFRISLLAAFMLMSFVLHRHSDNVPETKKWIIAENSSLRVNGSTNINTFSCEIPQYRKTDTLTLNNSNNNNDIALSGVIDLDVQDFDCHNPIMTHDLRKTLKVDKFPILRIVFLTLNKFPALTTRPEFITGLVDIEIAGIKKRFEVHYQIDQDTRKVIHLVGSRDVNFSDFNLIPPRKLGGMIRTRDRLSVDFRLEIRPLD